MTTRKALFEIATLAVAVGIQAGCGSSDTGGSEAGAGDVETHDAPSRRDSGGPRDASSADARHGDSSSPVDAGSSDAGSDSGSADGGTPESGSHDGGVADSAPHDGGSAEAGPGDGGSAETGPHEGGATEAGPDASSCTGIVALAGGTSSASFAATSVNAGTWNVTSLPTTSTSANPGLVAYAGGFMALFTAPSTGNIQYSLYSGSTWSATEYADGSSCTATPTAQGSVALATIGSTVHSVYLGSDSYFFHGTYTAGSWDCESDPLMDFGPQAPALASVGSSLVAVFDGMDGDLYTQSWSGSWASAAVLTGAAVDSEPPPPTVIALDGGSSDLMIVYEDATENQLFWSTRSGGTWSTPALTNVDAFTDAQVSAAPLSAGAAVVTFLGTDGNPYAMTFDPTSSSWTAPVAILTGGSALPAAPTVATGICGVDAIAEVIQPGGVELIALSSGTWSSPVTVSGTASSTFATIATSP
jgi:hypothetical protein